MCDRENKKGGVGGGGTWVRGKERKKRKEKGIK